MPKGQYIHSLMESMLYIQFFEYHIVLISLTLVLNFGIL